MAELMPQCDRRASAETVERGAPLFTVFTPTYNRAHTLHRVFDSLYSQTLREFEWLVVDDGSTDNTSKLIAGWQIIVEFPIRYLRQEHSGKHFAHNRAIREARGRYFVSLDSDDALVPVALERMAYHWGTIPENERSHFSSVGGLCKDLHGEIIGDRFPREPFDCSLRELHYRHRLRGERCGAARIEVLRKYPFPEIRGTRFIPEGSVWLEIAKTHKIRWVNEAFRIYRNDETGTGERLSGYSNLTKDAAGRLYYCTWVLENDLEYFFRSPATFIKAAILLPIFAHLTGLDLRATFKSLHGIIAKLLVVLFLPLALSLLVFDRTRALFCRTAARVKSGVSVGGLFG
jgi:glycosyltransferase involved in cell wall biosynthesis